MARTKTKVKLKEVALMKQTTNTIGEVVSTHQGVRELTAQNSKMHPVFLNWLRQAGNISKDTFENISESIEALKSDKLKELDTARQLVIETAFKDTTLSESVRQEQINTQIKALELPYKGDIEEYEAKLIEFQDEVMGEDSGVVLPKIKTSFIPNFISDEQLIKIYPSIEIEKSRLKEVEFRFPQLQVYLQITVQPNFSNFLKLTIVSIIHQATPVMVKFEKLRRNLLTHKDFGDYSTQRTAIMAEDKGEETEARIKELEEKFPEVSAIETEIAEFYVTPVKFKISGLMVSDLPEDGLTPRDFGLFLPLMNEN